MSTTVAPVAPEAFQLAIADLQLDQLHREAARLYNSIYYLERSNVSLEEFRDDEDCRIAFGENTVTIERQQERIKMIEAEVERRGFLMPCGERKGANGSTNAGTEETTVNGTVVGPENESGEYSRAMPSDGTAESVMNGAEVDDSNGEGGVYL